MPFGPRENFALLLVAEQRIARPLHLVLTAHLSTKLCNMRKCVAEVEYFQLTGLTQVMEILHFRIIWYIYSFDYLFNNIFFI